MKRSPEPVKFAAMLAAPLPFGPFLIDESGRLTARVPGTQPAFSFAWRGRRFFAALAGRHVTLTASIARVPSTAGAADVRDSVFATLRALPRLVPDAWAVRLTADHRLTIEAREDMEWPANASALLQPLVRFLIDLAPYVDLLDEAGLEPIPAVT